MWGIVLLIFFVAGSRQISVTEFSVPDAIEAGGDVLLQCGYELGLNETGKGLTIKWWFTPLNQSEDNRAPLYQRIAGQPPSKSKEYDIEIKGNDDILLHKVSPENSGTYECQVSAEENEKRVEDTLVVFTKGEMLLNVTEMDDGPDDQDDDDDVVITCEAMDVAPYPDLVITVNDEEVTSNDTLLDEDNNTFDVISVAALSRARADGADIGCELYFRNANITHEQYKITKTFHLRSDALTTTEGSEDASTTEATPGNRVIRTASNLLLVISAIFINIFAIKN